MSNNGNTPKSTGMWSWAEKYGIHLILLAGFGYLVWQEVTERQARDATFIRSELISMNAATLQSNATVKEALQAVIKDSAQREKRVESFMVEWNAINKDLSNQLEFGNRLMTDLAQAFEGNQQAVRELAEETKKYNAARLRQIEMVEQVLRELQQTREEQQSFKE